MQNLRARFLLRFDDVCPTTLSPIWEEIETTLNGLDIRPIVAVIPDNRDPALLLNDPSADFWPRVQRWQRAGWTIGLHGHQHVFRTTDPGIVGLNHYSEFAGIGFSEQVNKISVGCRILTDNGIRPDAWIAPAHSFDENTVLALAAVPGAPRIISDGLGFLPHRDGHGMFWIPQQLWRFRPMPIGVWTVCVHPNLWTSEDVRRFTAEIEKYRRSISDTREIERLFGARHPGFLDAAVATTFKWAIRAKTGCAKRRVVGEPASRGMGSETASGRGSVS
jgi:hypothetical protein